MGLFKPIIEWTKKKTTGEIDLNNVKDINNGIDNNFTDRTKIGEGTVDPNVKLNPEDVVRTPEDYKTDQQIRDNFSEDEQGVIDNYLDLLDEVEKDLDDIDQELDNRLDDLEIAYDPTENPLLAQAHKCPYCGVKNAPNIIKYKDIENNEKNNLLYNKTMLSNAIPGNVGSMTSRQVGAHQEQRLDSMMKSMLRIVWLQICIWVLEFVYNLVSPLKKVPFAKSIPKGVRNTINNLRRQMSVANQNVKGSEGFNNGTYIPFTPDEDENEEVAIQKQINEFNGTADVDSLAGLYSTCLIHTKQFRDGVDTIMADNKKNTYLQLKRGNMVMREVVSANKQLSSGAIPDGYEKKSGLRFTNTLPEAYLRARRDGKGVAPSFLLEGPKAVLDNVNRSWGKKVKRILKGWWESKETLCCILRNILKVGKITAGPDFRNGRTILLSMLGILEVLRNLLTVNIGQELSKGFNLLMRMIEGLIISTIAAMANMVKSEATKWLSDTIKLDNIMASDLSCLPWNEMVLAIGDYAKKLVEELLSYLADFVTNYKLITDQMSGLADKSKMLLMIEQWIEIITAILQFLQNWEICTNNLHSADSVVRNADLTEPFAGNKEPVSSETLQNSTKTSTIYNEEAPSGMKNIKPGSPYAQVFSKYEAVDNNNVVENITRKLTQDEISGKSKIQVDEESAIKIIMTNYLGISESDVSLSLGSTGDCACENVLSDKEIEEIRKAIMTNI